MNRKKHTAKDCHLCTAANREMRHPAYRRIRTLRFIPHQMPDKSTAPSNKPKPE